MSNLNILLVTIDCLRYDRCGFNGHHRDTTPTLDKLASDSLIYDLAVATGPRTNESVPGIVGGALSRDCEFFGEIAHKALKHPTLATWLSGEGYSTVASLANPQLSKTKNYDIGFDQFRNLRVDRMGEDTGNADQEDAALGSLTQRIHSLRRKLKESEAKALSPWMIPFIAYRVKQTYGQWPTVPGQDVVELLCDRLDTSGTPFFAWTHLNDLHAPLNPDRVRKGGLVEAKNVKQFVWDARRLARIPEPNYGAMYDSTLRYVDKQISRLISDLKSRGVWEDTLLIVTSDHGEALNDRGVYGHAAGNDRFEYDSNRDYLYDELIKVPLLVRHPSVQPTRISSPFSLAWLHELIADATGRDRPDFPTGSGRSTHQDTASNTSLVVSDAISEKGHTIAVRDKDIKMITECNQNKSEIEDGNFVFNTTQDPKERFNLGSKAAPDRLVRRAKEVVLPPDALSGINGRVNQRTKDLLADLGYR